MVGPGVCHGRLACPSRTGSSAPGASSSTRGRRWDCSRSCQRIAQLCQCLQAEGEGWASRSGLTFPRSLRAR
ncbi:hypothetical protein ACFFX0_30475 [Citricoccus parietis]|uniref:Uncharacterized protein n=1 Tax=Citricoccus parietis TaxID=592307 RepID=A0ABV5G8I8_9MICC